MIVTSNGILNGVIEDKYGKHGNSFNAHGMPTYSLPLKFENYPSETKSFAVVLEDKDAFPVSGGFSWIHWTVANLTKNELLENESQNATDFVQGVFLLHVIDNCKLEASEKTDAIDLHTVVKECRLELVQHLLYLPD